jgi:hypothetical protein
MSTVEDIQNNLVAKIAEMQFEFEEQKKNFKAEIDKLEKIIKAKNQEIEKLQTTSSWEVAESSDLLIKDQLEAVKKMNEAFQQDIQTKTKEINNFRKEVTQLKDENYLLKNDNTKYKEDLDKLKEENKKLKEIETEYETMKNQFILIQKQKEAMNEKEEKYKEEISKKNKEIEELKELNSKLETNNNELLKYVKEVQEKEEELKKEKALNEKMREREEESKKEMNKILKENENKDMDQEEKNKFLTDILCEYLLKLNNSQYFISVFQLLDNCMKHYDELKFFNKMDSLYGCPLNHTLYNFFGSFSSYINIANENVSLSDFLSQKTFKYSEINKNDIEIIKRISSIRLSKDISVLDLYRKKKETFFKSVNLTFDLLKNKIINDEDNKKNNMLNDKPDFLRITKPQKELIINFNEINMYKFSTLVDYQIYNILPKLQKLEIITSEAHLSILYSLVLNCPNLNSLKIILTSDFFNSINSSLEIFNDTLPVLFSYLRNLTEFSYDNIILSNKKIPDIVNAIKNSSIKKLSFISCFKSKEDLSLFNDYFHNPNCLTEINLSRHDFNVPTLLSSSLLNYSINKNLVSISFNSCNLNKEDIQYIANYIVQSPIMLSCNIGNNPLTPLACSTFAYCLQKTKSLEQLIMNNCGINGESLLFLFNGKGSQTLKHINISGNDIGDIGLVSIGAFIKNSPKLEIFELRNCGGTDMGFSSIVNTIHLNDKNSIKIIHYEKNKISLVTYEMLKKLNEIFKAKEVTFYLDKIEGEYKVDCVKFI